jgi:hypothetical protein
MEGRDQGGDCGVCAIFLDKVSLHDTTLVKGYGHAYWFVALLSDPLQLPTPFSHWVTNFSIRIGA